MRNRKTFLVLIGLCNLLLCGCNSNSGESACRDTTDGNAVCYLKDTYDCLNGNLTISGDKLYFIESQTFKYYSLEYCKIFIDADGNQIDKTKLSYDKEVKAQKLNESDYTGKHYYLFRNKEENKTEPIEIFVNEIFVIQTL